MKIRLSDIQDETAPTSVEERLYGANGLEEARNAWKQGASVGALLGRPPYKLDAPIGLGKPNRRSDVFAVELLLDKAGDLERPSGPSGIYDGELEDAIKSFQRKHGLIDDGMLRQNGPTLRRLEGAADLDGKETGAQLAQSVSGAVPPGRQSFPGPQQTPIPRPIPFPPALEKYRDIIVLGGIDIEKNAAEAKKLSQIEMKNKLRTEGEWDYKNNEKLAQAAKNGAISRQDLAEFGNVHYGYVAAAKGLDLGEALSLAGVYQAFVQGGGSVREALSGGVASQFVDDKTAEALSTHGFSWGDKPDDPPQIAKGWNLYHGR